MLGDTSTFCDENVLKLLENWGGVGGFVLGRVKSCSGWERNDLLSESVLGTSVPMQGA